MDKNLRASLCEFLGTFIVVFLTAGIVCVNHLAAVHWYRPEQGTFVQPEPGLVGIALVAGLSYAVALVLTLPFSGGYLNPAVTLMLWVFRRVDGSHAAGMMVAQLLGAAVAGMLLWMLLPEDLVLVPTRIGTPHLNPKIWNPDEPGRLGAMIKGVGLEVILSAVVTFILLATLLDPRVQRSGGWAGRLGALWVGLSVTAVTLVGYGLTGAGLNPARWFGTVIWEMAVPGLRLRDPFYDHLAYWLGPTVGTLLAGTVYVTWIMPEEETKGV